MLKEQNENPLLGIFEDGMEQFQGYQRVKDEQYRTKRQKFNAKMEKLEADLNDPQQKKERNHKRRQAQKKKINALISNMTEVELKQFITERKKTKQAKKLKAKEGMVNGDPILLDLAYMDMMSDIQSKSLAKQIHLITKAILHVQVVPSVHVCGLKEGQFKEQLKKMGYQYWPVTPHEEDVGKVEEALGRKIVYLSPDAEKDLAEVQPGTAYILGGLVDRTVIKDASVHRARELGVQARKLPIRQFMKNRYCLNLDHVVMMLCKYRECGDWKTAFDFGAPKRWKKGEGKGEEEKKEKREEGEHGQEGNSEEEVDEQ